MYWKTWCLSNDTVTTNPWDTVTLVWVLPASVSQSRCKAFKLVFLLLLVPPIIPVVTAQGGGGSFKNRKPIGEVGGCELRDGKANTLMDRKVLEVSSLSLSFSDYLLPYQPIFYVSIYLSIYLSLSLFHLITYLPIYLSTYLPISLSIYLSLSLSLFHLSICLAVYLSVYLPVYLSTCLSVVQCHSV